LGVVCYSGSMEKKKDSLKALRHTAEHILTQAMYTLYPKIHMAMGPATEDGFYFDFDPGEYRFSEDDFPKIEAEMKKIIVANLPLTQEKISVAEARKLFSGNPYKEEWLNEIEGRGEVASIYRTADKFADLCAGPHVKSTGQVKAFKLLSIAGAYWRGDEKNKMLTRIYGTAFATQKELDEYLKRLEEAKKRDHRKIGRELDLFSFHPAAPSDVFWHPKGYTIMKDLFAYWREIHEREGYVEVRTPELLTRKVWDQSGHTGFFLEKMYKVTTPDSKEWNMAVKPMNCDGGILIYKAKQRSYKEFPLRMGELGVVHRFESSGETLGIIRPREFTQDDAHIYCTPNQVKSELKRVVELCFEVYEKFGLTLDHLELSTRPEKSIGSDEVWEKAESIMREVLKEGKTEYQINEGDGAFYGPKFDFHLKNAVGRTWQCSTIQLDFAQPENFDLEYVTSSGKKERPVMIHRVLYGSVERFLGILIEHFGGVFPTWLAPVQIVVVPISEAHNEYAKKVKEDLGSCRVEVDNRDSTMQGKIRDAELQKVPYILVVGDKEVKEGTVAVRSRATKKQQVMKVDEFAKVVQKEISERILKSFLS
jgi:threonyl-tRNA synthetase